MLERGYSLTTRADDGQLIRTVDELAIGQRVRTRIAGGQFVSRVETIELAAGQAPRSE